MNKSKTFFKKNPSKLLNGRLCVEGSENMVTLIGQQKRKPLMLQLVKNTVTSKDTEYNAQVVWIQIDAPL